MSDDGAMYSLSTIKVGEWCAVLDSSNKWRTAQILTLDDGKRSAAVRFRTASPGSVSFVVPDIEARLSTAEINLSSTEDQLDIEKTTEIVPVDSMRCDALIRSLQNMLLEAQNSYDNEKKRFVTPSDDDLTRPELGEISDRSVSPSVFSLFNGDLYDFIDLHMTTKKGNVSDMCNFNKIVLLICNIAEFIIR